MYRILRGPGCVLFAVGGIWLYVPLQLLAADNQAPQAASTPDDLAMKLIGTWKLEESKTPGSPSGIGTRLKFYSGTHWCVIQPDPVTGLIVFQHGGRYVVEGNKTKETVDFAGASSQSAIGKSGTYSIQIDGETLKSEDANNVFNERWKRMK